MTKMAKQVRSGDRLPNGDRIFSTTQQGGLGTPVTLIIKPAAPPVGGFDDPRRGLIYEEYDHDEPIEVLVRRPR